MDSTPVPPPKKNKSGCLVKIVLCVSIMFAQAVINAAIIKSSEKSRGRANPIVSIIGIFACIAVLAWRPRSSEDSETSIKPLDKDE